MQCHAYTYVVSVHVVSYAYSILCHSYVTYIVPYPAYLRSLLCLPIVLSFVGLPSLLVSYAFPMPDYIYLVMYVYSAC